MSNRNPSRIQPGVREGGQFTTSARGEADVALIDRTPAGEVFMPDPHDYPNTFIERGDGDATVVFVDYSEFHTAHGNISEAVLEPDEDGNTWVDGAGQRRLAHKLSRITGLKVEIEEDYGGDDPHVALSVHMKGVGHLSDDELTEQAHPFLAEALNTTDPGTFGSEYLYSGLEQWTEKEAQDVARDQADTGRYFAKATNTLDPDYAQGAQVHPSLIDDDGSLMVESFADLDNELHPETVDRMRTDLQQFLTRNGHLVDRARKANPDYHIGVAVSDFWLERNEAGTGFEDRGLGDAGEDLAHAARAFGAFELEIGDDGMVHGRTVGASMRLAG